MSWVPLVGSALGSLIGGMLSDLLIRRMLKAYNLRNNIRSESMDYGYKLSQEAEPASRVKDSFFGEEEKSQHEGNRDAQNCLDLPSNHESKIVPQSTG